MLDQNESTRDRGRRDPMTADGSGTGEQEAPATNVLTAADRQDEPDEDAKQNPDAPQHGGYGRPV